MVRFLYHPRISLRICLYKIFYTFRNKLSILKIIKTEVNVFNISLKIKSFISKVFFSNFIANKANLEIFAN